MGAVKQPGAALRSCLLLAPALLALFLYWPATGFDFLQLLDDHDYVTHHPVVAGGLSLEGVGKALVDVRVHYWIPVTLLSYMADAQFFGMSAGAFHRTNILIFALAVFGLTLVFTALTGSRWLSLLAAALFAAHPLRVESVAWITERKDMLALLFLVVALGCHLRYVAARRPGWLAGTTAAMALGLMAKPSLMTLPLLLLLLDYWPLGRFLPVPSAVPAAVRLRGLLVEKAPLFALSAAAFLLTMRVHAPGLVSGAAASLATRLEVSACSFFFYLGKTAWPAGLAFRSRYAYLNPAPAAVALSAVGLLLLLALAWRRWGRAAPHAAAGWSWYVAALLPASGLVPFGIQVYADRFTLLPHVGLALGLVWAAGRAVRGRPALRPALALLGVGLVLALGVATRRLLPAWRDDVSLFERSERLHGFDPLVAANLGYAYANAGRFAEALDRLERALPYLNFTAPALRDMGSYAERLGRPDQAEAYYRRSLAADAGSPRTQFALGSLLAGQGRLAEAAELLEDAFRRDPTSVEAAYNLALALAGLGRTGPAERYYREALRLKPGDVPSLVNLAILQAQAGRTDEAAANLREALRHDPGSPLAREWLGRLEPGRGPAGRGSPGGPGTSR
jgi:tetratricopeptide (TPR) repeat protein